MSRIRSGAWTLVATALAVSGCGSAKSSHPGEATSALSRSELIAKADAICRRVNVQRSSMPSIKTRQDFGVILPRISAYERTAVAELARLTPPASMATDWKQIVAADRTLAGYTGVYGQYVASYNARAARALMRAAVNIQRPTVAIAKRDGFSDCTQFAA